MDATVKPIVSNTSLTGSGTGEGRNGGTLPGTNYIYQPVSSGFYWKYASTGSTTDEQTQTHNW